MIALQTTSRIRALSQPTPQSATFRVLKSHAKNVARLRLPSLQRDNNRVVTEPSERSLFPQQVTMARKLLMLGLQSQNLKEQEYSLKVLKAELTTEFNDMRLRFDQTHHQLINQFNRLFKALRKSIRLQGSSSKQQQSHNLRTAVRVGSQFQELSQLSKVTSSRVQFLTRDLTGQY